MAKIKINEDEFPANSITGRNKVAPIREKDQEETEREPKKRRRLAQAQVIQKKRTFTQSIAQLLVGDESRSALRYIFGDVLLPAAKNTIQEAVTSGIEMILFGETRRSGRSHGRDHERVSYGSYYSKSRDRDESPYDPRSRSARRFKERFNLDEIYFKNHKEAEEVLDGLCDLLEEYESVSVADFFELAGIDGATWAHNKWGWTSLRKAYNTHTPRGWAIVFPTPQVLED